MENVEGQVQTNQMEKAFKGKTLHPLRTGPKVTRGIEDY